MLANQFLGINGRSMYPILSHSTLLKSLETLKQTTIAKHGSAKCLVRAATTLQKDSSTEIIDVRLLALKNTFSIQTVEVTDYKGRLNSIGCLISSACWLKMVPLAEDCQSCNVLLMAVDNGVVLRTIRRIAKGESLLMWFTESILAMLNMPFLKPANIQGQNRYACHQCNSFFEFPNPLKVHLALHCGKFDRSHLWTILAKEFRSLSQRNIIPRKIKPFEFELTGSPRTSPATTSPIMANTMVPSLTPPNRSTRSSSRKSPIPENLSLRHSAFKPYPHKATRQNNNSAPFYAPDMITHSPKMVQSPYQIQPAPAEPALHAEEMETIVSNLGRSKQGHLCVYCGKVYSRKYGLKIHIRTHTGYKPLKCKYCQRPFGDPSNLNKHVRLHAEGNTPYKCELCGKVLVRRRDLERHMRSRHQKTVERLEVSDASSDCLDVE